MRLAVLVLESAKERAVPLPPALARAAVYAVPLALVASPAAAVRAGLPGLVALPWGPRERLASALQSPA
jgi:hypothetical protein